MTDSPLVEYQDYKCERCGFEYKRRQDFPPHLCTRCTRFLGKGNWKLAMQIQPALPVPKEPEL